MTLIVQVKQYPFTKGSTSKSVIIQETDPEMVVMHVKKLYEELRTVPEATITFYRS